MKGSPEVGVLEFAEKGSAFPYQVKVMGRGQRVPLPFPTLLPARRIPAAENHCLSMLQAPAKTSKDAVPGDTQ